MGVSINGGTSKSSILVGFSLKNHRFWGTPISGNPHMGIFANKTILITRHRWLNVRFFTHVPQIMLVINLLAWSTWSQQESAGCGFQSPWQQTDLLVLKSQVAVIKSLFQQRGSGHVGKAPWIRWWNISFLQKIDHIFGTKLLYFIPMIFEIPICNQVSSYINHIFLCWVAPFFQTSATHRPGLSPPLQRNLGDLATKGLLHGQHREMKMRKPQDYNTVVHCDNDLRQFRL